MLSGTHQALPGSEHISITPRAGKGCLDKKFIEALLAMNDLHHLEKNKSGCKLAILDSLLGSEGDTISQLLEEDFASADSGVQAPLLNDVSNATKTTILWGMLALVLPVSNSHIKV